MATDHFDDPNIPDQGRVFRLVSLNVIVPKDDGTAMVSSGAFKDLELSVNLEGVMQPAGRGPQDSLRSKPNDLLVGFTAGVCRQHRQLVGPDPTPEEPAHGYVFGTKTLPIRRALRSAVEWIVPERAPSWEEIRLRKKQLQNACGDPGND
jgi:hypothetical protein